MASESLLFPLWLGLLENVSFYLMLLPFVGSIVFITLYFLN